MNLRRIGSLHVSSEATTLEIARLTISANPGIRLLTYQDYGRIKASGMSSDLFGFSGPVWLDTKIGCGIYAVMILSPNGQIFDGRYNVGWDAYTVAVDKGVTTL